LLLWTLLGIFVGGLALNLTPCVYPLIPITVSYFGGRSAQGKSLVGHGICYIGGLALTNSSLGLVAALTGGLIAALLQSPPVLIAIAAMLAAFAMSLFGFWELRLPFWLTQLASKSYPGFFGSFFMGITLGVVAAPCIGPFVLGLLTWVATLVDPLLGFVIFFYLEPWFGRSLVFTGIVFGATGKASQIRRVDELGTTFNGLGSYWHGGLFCSVNPAAIAPAAPPCRSFYHSGDPFGMAEYNRGCFPRVSVDQGHCWYDLPGTWGSQNRKQPKRGLLNVFLIDEAAAFSLWFVI
jgi:cytochrome c biogenesis protein CcdA